MRQNWTFIDLFCTSFAKVHNSQNLPILFWRLTSLLNSWKIAAWVLNPAAVDTLLPFLPWYFANRLKNRPAIYLLNSYCAIRQSWIKWWLKAIYDKLVETFPFYHSFSSDIKGIKCKKKMFREYSTEGWNADREQSRLSNSLLETGIQPFENSITISRSRILACHYKY